jgi:molybdopterin-guanine dinucleotide biosynthesis protein A
VLSLLWRNSGAAAGLSTPDDPAVLRRWADAGDTHGVSEPASYAVVVLAGGTSRRMGGGDKTALDLGAGRSVLSHLVGGLETAVPVVVVGPERPLERSVRWTREQPVGGGPLAAFAAGVDALAADRPRWVVLLAGDQPFAADAVAHLMARTGAGVDAVVGVDGGGRDQPLLAAYRMSRVRAALGPRGPEVAGHAMAWLLDRLQVVRLELPETLLIDVDDAASLARARAALAQDGQA